MSHARHLSRFLLLLAAISGTNSATPVRAQLAPFVLPWNDTAAGVTDFSSLNRPITADARLAVSPDGHFTARGERVRFIGVNFAGDAPFMPTNKAAAVAGRLAKFGVNCVRFHHIDASWATGGGVLQYTATSSRQINSAQLDRIHCLVARLGAAGIYSDLNLLTAREYRSGDGLGASITGMDSKDLHILACFNDTALGLQKEFATRLLTPTNRFNGLPLARDPAVGFVEVINENGLLQKWYDGGLDRLPTDFAAQLRQRWNDWLARRYPGEAALLASWKIADTPLGTNLLKNGNFAAGTANWNLEQHTTAAATAVKTSEFNGSPSLRLTVTRVGSESWHVQFNQAGLRMTEGRAYTLTFSARTSATGPLDYAVMMAHDPWQTLGLSGSVSLTTNWQTFTRTFVATATDTAVRVNFGGIGTRLVTVWLGDVRFQEGGAVGTLPAGTSLAARSIPAIRFGNDSFAGTAEARRDWLRCLIELENGYYDAMVGHLRTNVGYAGLIFGTIMANSPAAVQSRLDVIDAHAYWQHPVFPGTPWDANNWTVRNVSLLNSAPADTTLAGLARQRLHGKPFTVTEYQHPAPNSFAAEAPLLMAAYGALQDWDGFWMFDYGWGNDATQGGEANPMGRVRSWFDTGQHPTRMANLLVAANLFRRADLARAGREITMALTPELELDHLQRGAGAWSIFAANQFGLPGGHAMVSRVSVDYGPNPSGLATPPAAPGNGLSDTGELSWENPATGGVLTINTPRTRSVVGFVAGRSFGLGDVTIRALANRLGWASAALTLVKGDSLAGGGTALLVATGECQNTGQTWKTAAKESLSSWGTAPTLVETVPLEVTLPVPLARARAWRLDAQGQRGAAAEVRADAAGRAVVVTHANDATLWYEIEIDPPARASFDDWRREQFTPDELLRPEISGDQAAPAGDGISNLLKYALGLAAKQRAVAGDLPQWGVRTGADGRTLWLAYARRKTAPDIDLRAWFSAGLPAWSVSPESVLSEADGIQRIRTEQAIPASAPAIGLLKLELRRNGG